MATDSQARITLSKPEFPILRGADPLWFLDSCQLLAVPGSQFSVEGRLALTEH